MSSFTFESSTGIHLNLEKLWSGTDGPKLSGEMESRFRDADASLRAKFRSGAVGFYDWPLKVSPEELREVESIALGLRESCGGALLFGIGGSHLGAAAVHQALLAPGCDFPLHWVSNVDPCGIREADHFLKTHKEVAAVVVSKSGGTTETLAAFFHFAGRLNKRHFVAITDPASGNLRRLADKEGWASLPVPPNVGGRFSVLTAVGLLPVALGGLEHRELLEGAKRMREELERSALRENPAYLLAAALHHWDTVRKRSVQVLMPYWSNLTLLADWYVQLFGESLGKRLLKDPKIAVGPTPVGALGTTDQHSLLQLFKEGPADKLVGFIDVKTSEGDGTVGTPPFDPGDNRYLVEQTFGQLSILASQATEKSLNNSGMPTYRITLEKLSERTLGALFFLFETACAFAGELYGVDAFNQPGVEETKRLLRQAL